MGSIKMATISGTFMVLLFSIDAEELVSTIILAAIGAIVSFAISWILERLAQRRRKK